MHLNRGPRIGMLLKTKANEFELHIWKQGIVNGVYGGGGEKTVESAAILLQFN